MWVCMLTERQPMALTYSRDTGPRSERDGRRSGTLTGPPRGNDGKLMGQAQQHLPQPASGWRDLNPRPLRPERSALPSCATPRVPWKGHASVAERPEQTLPDHASRHDHAEPSPERRKSGYEVRVNSVASGGQAKRNGAYGEVPNPALTCNALPRCSLRPRARRASRSQFVTSAP